MSPYRNRYSPPHATWWDYFDDYLAAFGRVRSLAFIRKARAYADQHAWKRPPRALLRTTLLFWSTR